MANIINKENSNYIKLVAALTMLLDHIGAFLFPLDILRIIGRLSFPLFAYQLGVGYSMTSNKVNYLMRLIGFGIISQIPFNLLNNNFNSQNNHWTLNIFFTLALGIITIWLIKKNKLIFLVIPFFLSYFVEYGIYGLTLILIFYFFKNNIVCFSAFGLVTLIYSYFYSLFIQFYSLLAYIILLAPKPKINLPRNFFYIFYPAHLLIIYLIKIYFLKI